MKYQPLNVEKNEIRLLKLIANSDYATSAVMQGNEPENMIRLRMKTVSLDDFTPESRDFIESKGSSKNKRKFWDERQLFNAVIPTCETSEEKVIALQQISDTVSAAAERPDWGRWTWGDYNTLSYVWGLSRERRAVFVNGEIVEITQNLWEYFHGQMLDPRPDSFSERLWLWVDAICIDQQNVEERNAQVKMMKNIYDQAQACIAWLGPASDDSDKAMALLFNLGIESFETQAEVIEYLSLISEDQDLLGLGTWKALANFFFRPYWSRLWVMQEILLSKSNLMICCGSQGILWGQLYVAMSVLSGSLVTAATYLRLDYENEEDATEEFEKIWGLFADQFSRLQMLSTLYKIENQKGDGLYSIDTVLPLAQTAHQTDERDKVYGILSLIDEKISTIIEPDYKLSIAETYLNFVKATIIATQSLDILCQSRFNSSRRKELPSWVMDLSAELVVSFELARGVPNYASKERLCYPVFQGSTLLVEGFVFDRIDGLAANKDLPDDPNDDFIIPKYANNMYGSDANTREALWRTMVGNRDGFGNNVSDLWSGLLEIPWFMDDSELALFGYYPDYLDRILELSIGENYFFTYFDTKGKPNILSEEWVTAAIQRAVGLATGRRFITTDKGYIGMAANTAKQGDLIVIAFGSSVPFILRPAADGDTYTFVGESYVHGIMDGEAIDMLDEGKFNVQKFILS